MDIAVTVGATPTMSKEVIMAKRQPKYETEYIVEQIELYLEREEIPILKDLCYQQNWDYDYFMVLRGRDEEVDRSIKKLINRKEAQLEKLALQGKIDKTMAVFSLKQLGWKDRQEIALSDDAKLKAMTSYLGGIKDGKTKDIGRKNTAD